MQRQTIDFCDVAKAKQAAREALIPAEWRLEPEQLHRLSHAPIEALEASGGLLTPRELLITSSSAQDLLSHLHATAQEERWTAVEVTRAFCKRASLAHQLTNCLTEIFFDDALRRAAELDAYMAQHGQPVGPLAGLPISLKDCFNVGGYDSTLGFVAWANDAQPADSALVGILRRAGAVLYCKTNVPTAMMIAESVNNVWGRTFSPHNVTMTSGGSSGGESALLAMRGSPLGVGTDIGGSIRIPAALCGLYGLKPSFGRFPTFGARSGMAGQESINSINGPMSADLESLSIFARAVVGAEPWRIDPKCVPLPWRNVSDLPSTGLVFGVLFDDGRVHPTPPVTRALHVVVDALKAQGHTVIEWESKEELSFAHDLTQQFFTADGREGISGIMEHGGEADKWIEGLGPVVQKKSIHELWQVQAKRTQWAAKVLQRWQSIKGPNGRAMDALLSPATPHAGAENGKFGKHVGFTSAWNLMDYPGVTFPVVKADKHLDSGPRPDSFYHQDDELIWQNYSADKVHGLPTSLQLVGERLQEEKLLAVLERVVDALPAWNNK